MKKAKLAIIAASALALLCGCNKIPKENKKPLEKFKKEEGLSDNISMCKKWYFGGYWNAVYSLKIDGHDYLTINTCRAVSMIHSHSCPCMNKRKQDHEDKTR